MLYFFVAKYVENEPKYFHTQFELGESHVKN